MREYRAVYLRDSRRIGCVRAWASNSVFEVEVEVEVEIEICTIARYTKVWMAFRKLAKEH
jgi:hypothetical protein